MSDEAEEKNDANNKVLISVDSKEDLVVAQHTNYNIEKADEAQKEKNKLVGKNSCNPHGNDDDADASDSEDKLLPLSTSVENVQDIVENEESKETVVKGNVSERGNESSKTRSGGGADDIDGHDEDSIRISNSTKSESEGIAVQSRFINVKAELESVLARRLESSRSSHNANVMASTGKDGLDGSFETRTTEHGTMDSNYGSKTPKPGNGKNLPDHSFSNVSDWSSFQNNRLEEKAEVEKSQDHSVSVVTYTKFQRDTASFTTRPTALISPISTIQNAPDVENNTESSVNGQSRADSSDDTAVQVANFHVESEIQPPKTPTFDRPHSPPAKDFVNLQTSVHLPRLPSIEELDNVGLQETEITTQPDQTISEQDSKNRLDMASDSKDLEVREDPAEVDPSSNDINNAKSIKKYSSHQEIPDHSDISSNQGMDLQVDHTDGLKYQNTCNSFTEPTIPAAEASVSEASGQPPNQMQTTGKDLSTKVEIESGKLEDTIDGPATAVASTSVPQYKEIPKKPKRKRLSKRRSDLSLQSDRSMSSADIDLITPWESQDYDFVRGQLRPSREEIEKQADEWVRARVNLWVESGKGRKEPIPPLSVRRVAHREKLLTQRTVKSSGFVLLKNTKRKRVQQFSNFVDNISYTLALWGKSIRTIEGYHGAGVASYFLFLRWLFGLNIILFVLMTCFVVIPMGLVEENPLTPSTNTAYNTSYYCSQNYTVIEGSGITVFLDFIQGSGWMEKTLLFYGYYANGLDSSYNLPLAYVFTVLVCLMISLGLMARYTGSSFKEALLNEASTNFEYSNKIFGAWDYSLTDLEAAELRQKGIHYDVQSDMLEQTFMRKRIERLESKCSMCKLYFIRLLVNFIIIVSLGGAAYLIYYVTTFSTEYASDNEDASGADSWLLLLVQYLPSIAITACNAALPILFEAIVTLEDYSQAFVIKITLVRTVFLRLASMIVLVITLYTEITCSSQNSCRATIEPKCTDIKCWETYVGQQFYKLVITDFIVTVLKVLAVELPRKLLYEKCQCGLIQKLGPPEFNIPSNVLDLVYGQCLVWLGFLFTPLLPGMVVAKCFIVFYAKKLSALVACPPAEKPYKASRINTFFMIILLMAYFLCALPIIFSIFGISPSRGCGPFRVLDYMNEAIKNTVESWPSVLSSSYGFITSAAVTGTIIVLLCMALYYQTNMSAAHRQKAELFKEQLIMEGRDKQFLLSKLQDIYASPGKKNPEKNPKRSKPRPEEKVTTVNERSRGQGNEGSFSPPHVVDNGDW